jgi:hypothetical protein
MQLNEKTNMVIWPPHVEGVKWWAPAVFAKKPRKMPVRARRSEPSAEDVAVAAPGEDGIRWRGVWASCREAV